MILQLNTESKLTFITLILIFLVTIQFYFHENHQFSEKSSPTFTNDFHVHHINSTQPSKIPKKSSPTKKNDTNFNHIKSFDPFPYQFLHIVGNPDGTITRLQEFFPTIPASNNIDFNSYSISKDVLLDPRKNTWVRIFLPQKSINNPKKLPIVVFVHGGGFILYNPASPLFHNFCSELASQLDVLVISVEYRLAPENRLPAAYEDVFEALLWVKDGKNEWVKKYGNFSRCILMGHSAGGNIVYNVMLTALDYVNDLRPLTIAGFVLIQPAFGGIKRTGSELRSVYDPMTPLVVGDLMWDLALPVGAGQGHEFCDPTIGGGPEKLGRIRKLGWWVVVVGCDGDPLIDREVRLFEMLKKKGVMAKSLFTKGGYHSVHLIDPVQMRQLFVYIEKLFKEL
ncbi:hypothetical protein RND81_02G143500 [Saponaria officinalis]|uniref:Alpha/beta hydrolase fold-3 domain-containing protein n=1 Tax=Saponaria officinalis TaxID=3572 RepID=A0AAW1MQK2_SAPOF